MERMKADPIRGDPYNPPFARNRKSGCPSFRYSQTISGKIIFIFSPGEDQ